MSDIPTINDYIDAAEARLAKLYNLGKCTDRELGRRLGLSNAAVSGWRRGKAYPDDEMMQRLAEIADMNVPAALAWLGHWRNKGAVALTYEGMARRLGGAATAFFCAAFLGAASLVLGADRAEARAAGTDRAQGNLAPIESVYYGKFCRRRRAGCWPGLGSAWRQLSHWFSATFRRDSSAVQLS